ncbi:hypothetical protein TSTA_096070 [Talaromyces stipitatus ATCC 10500]|uniref:Uncharacterized protein n=1 Tax=Talaromyces stipitatus (strain ATCC 10500 / CBS 375.48 / QM 6759 / NRRL 1006) TaxID=441959 RepID=B8M3I6_TALSN|nr:uncharacterized protein TSTA_096070 [Talaromyces stipitatus ATCC 10500]EED22358.1 hypothetical protein TSTA_096070 [Talaromyces stipitatus ATCC 10500]
MKTTSNYSNVLPLLAFLWETASADNTLSRYKQPLPPNIQIADTKPKLRELQDANPGALVGPENGGWFLKYPDSGKVVAATSDNLTIDLDQRYMSFYHHLEEEGNHEEAADVLRELQENGADLQKLKADWNCGGSGEGMGLIPKYWADFPAAKL